MEDKVNVCYPQVEEEDFGKAYVPKQHAKTVCDRNLTLSLPRSAR